MQGRTRSHSNSGMINISEGDFPMCESAIDPMHSQLQSIWDLLTKDANMTNGYELSSHSEIMTNLNQSMFLISENVLWSIKTEVDARCHAWDQDSTM